MISNTFLKKGRSHFCKANLSLLRNFIRKMLRNAYRAPLCTIGQEFQTQSMSLKFTKRIKIVSQRSKFIKTMKTHILWTMKRWTCTTRSTMSLKKRRKTNTQFLDNSRRNHFSIKIIFPILLWMLFITLQTSIKFWVINFLKLSLWNPFCIVIPAI